MTQDRVPTFRSMKTELMRRQVRDNLTILMLFGTLILIQKTVSYWNLMNEELEQQALVLTLPLKPALQSHDKQEALRCISIVEDLASIVDARVTTPADPDFARYSKDSPTQDKTPNGLSWLSYSRSFPVFDNDERIGVLTLTRTLDDIYQGILLYALIVMTMGLVVWFASILFARSVHEKFSASFRHMIQTMKAMQDKPQAALPGEAIGRASFEEVQFILQEFQKMTRAIFERDQRLIAANSVLEEKVMERTRELKLLQERLVEEAHKAGMADVASSVLHNFGNILSSISIDCSILREMVRTDDNILSFEKVMEHLGNEQKLLEILNSPQKFDTLRRLFKELENQAQDERHKYHEIADRMNEQLYLMKDLIYYQQNFATGQALFQMVGLQEILELAFHIKFSLMKTHGVTWSVEVPENCQVQVQKTKFLHVFANLIVNAIDAMKNVPGENRRLHVWTEINQTEARIHFRDFGSGIPKDKFTRIFSLGFTTKESGHGFGLHSSANYMREMNGSLELDDPQPEEGAAFLLRIKRTSSSHP